MKLTFATIACVAALALGSCGQKSTDQDGHNHGQVGEPLDPSPNDALNEEVMKVHDEVMPKMNDIFRLKEELKNKIASTPDLAEEKKKSIEARIASLDSASESMMVWMRQFNPPADSLGEEKAREYLENEMEKIKEVRENVLTSIEKAKAENE